MCDIQGCDELPEYYDPEDNRFCRDCALRDMRETMNSLDDYERIQRGRTWEAMSKLNSRESIWGFCGWLISRDEVTTMSSSDTMVIAKLITRFCDANNLPAVSIPHPGKLVFPTEDNIVDQKT